MGSEGHLQRQHYLSGVLHKLLYFNLSFAGALYYLPFPDKETELQKFKLTKATELENERPR